MEFRSCVNIGTVSGAGNVGGFFGYIFAHLSGNKTAKTAVLIDCSVNAGTVTGTSNNICGFGGIFTSWGEMMIK